MQDLYKLRIQRIIYLFQSIDQYVSSCYDEAQICYSLENPALMQ